MRESGILMHITSLPGPYGIGTLGESAKAFISFLKDAGQSYWQILPVNPTGYGNSPYQAFSTFAGNHYLIDLDTLVQQGLLTEADLKDVDFGTNPQWVDFGALYQNRTAVLRKAFDRFVPDEGFAEYRRQNEMWLPDYCLFMALKTDQGGMPWLQWPLPLRLRQPEALEEKRGALSQEIYFHEFLQYQFHLQWQQLRQTARENGIRIIGDVPIYVPMDSADVWSNPELFQLDENRHPVVVAGCPPDAFTQDGQLWGNPIYDWQRVAQQDYRWWICRLQAAQQMYDVVRIDHFRGFESYWAVPAKDETARYGHWVKGPGMDLIGAIRKALPDFPFIAEDLGFITPEVRQLQLDSGYPGMKVLEFAFDTREESDYLPHTYPVESVCYTGTHDNATMVQWLQEITPEELAYCKAYMGLSQEEGYVWGMIRGAMSSVSRLCVVQMQDYLELGKEARMNLPGGISPANWTWRAVDGFASPELGERIREITNLYGRSR